MDINEAISLLEQKRALMTDFLNWTKAQTALIDHENLEFLDKNIEVKQTIIDKIDVIDEKYREFETLVKAQGITEMDANEIAQLKREIKDIAGEAIKVDNINREMSQRLLTKYRREMENTTKAHNVMKAYSQSSVNDQMFTGNFINKKS